MAIGKLKVCEGYFVDSCFSGMDLGVNRRWGEDGIGCKAVIIIFFSCSELVSRSISTVCY